MDVNKVLSNSKEFSLYIQPFFFVKIILLIIILSKPWNVSHSHCISFSFLQRSERLKLPASRSIISREPLIYIVLGLFWGGDKNVWVVSLKIDIFRVFLACGKSENNSLKMI